MEKLGIYTHKNGEIGDLCHKNGEIGDGNRGKSVNPLLNRAGANTPGPRQRGGGCGELRAEATGQGGGCLPLGKRLGGCVDVQGWWGLRLGGG